MVNTAASFGYSVSTFYAFYHHFLKNDGSFRDLALDHLLWEFLFLAATITFIYFASLVTSEVLAHTHQRIENMIYSNDIFIK